MKTDSWPSSQDKTSCRRLRWWRTSTSWGASFTPLEVREPQLDHVHPRGQPVESVLPGFDPTGRARVAPGREHPDQPTLDLVGLDADGTGRGVDFGAAVPGVNRRLYDLTPKPPATVEYV